MSWVAALAGIYAESAGYPLLIGLAVGGLASALVAQPLNKTVHLALLLFGVSLLGATVGFSGGMSREGVVGLVIPSALTLMGGVALYVFGADTSKGGAVSITAGCFAMAVFLGYANGSQIRNDGDEWRNLREACIGLYGDKDILANAEAFARLEQRMGKNCDKGLSWPTVPGTAADAPAAAS